ncbi:MAG TPA: type II secretion system F family protein [Roseiflexaceae bacterium]|nr:type II secretion system F family protein [Roseiflexaceae bacterium]
MTPDVTQLIAIGASLLAGLAMLTLALGLWRLVSRNTEVESRLDTYMAMPATIDGNALAPPDPIISERINNAINQRGFADRIARDLGQAHVPLSVPEYILIRLAIMLLAAIVALFLWRDILVVPPAILVGFVAPIFWLRNRRKKRNRNFNDQLAETVSVMATSLRGGFSLLQSVANAAKEAQEPTKTELRRVTQEVQLGLGLGQALDNLVARVESDDLDLVVTAIKINARVGGNLTHILETISHTIRERSRLQREVRVITSMQRMSSYVIGLLPFGLALIILAINPAYIMRLFEPGWILCIPIGAVISAVLGFILIQRIVDIKY